MNHFVDVFFRGVRVHLKMRSAKYDVSFLRFAVKHKLDSRVKHLSVIERYFVCCLNDMIEVFSLHLGFIKYQNFNI